MATCNNSVNVHTNTQQTLSTASASVPVLPPKSALQRTISEMGETTIDFPPMPLCAPKLIQVCTSTNCICGRSDKRCIWWEANLAGKALGEAYDTVKANPESSDIIKALRQAEELSNARRYAESVQNRLRRTEDDTKLKIAEELEWAVKVADLIAIGQPTSIVPKPGVHSLTIEKFTWPEASSELFELLITWNSYNYVCYTPNSRHEEEGLTSLGEEPQSYSLFYQKNGRVQFYMYRSISGTIWEIGFVHGCFNSASPLHHL